MPKKAKKEFVGAGCREIINATKEINIVVYNYSA